MQWNTVGVVKMAETLKSEKLVKMDRERRLMHFDIMSNLEDDPLSLKVTCF